MAEVSTIEVYRILKKQFTEEETREILDFINLSRMGGVITNEYLYDELYTVKEDVKRLKGDLQSLKEELRDGLEKLSQDVRRLTMRMRERTGPASGSHRRGT